MAVLPGVARRWTKGLCVWLSICSEWCRILVRIYRPVRRHIVSPVLAEQDIVPPQFRVAQASNTKPARLASIFLGEFIDQHHIKSREMEAILRKWMQRKETERKQSAFRLRGIPVEEAKIYRYLRGKETPFLAIQMPNPASHPEYTGNSPKGHEIAEPSHADYNFLSRHYHRYHQERQDTWRSAP
jgi:hypothetical protein